MCCLCFWLMLCMEESSAKALSEQFITSLWEGVSLLTKGHI